MAEYTYGRGTHEQFDAYMEFINMVFGFTKGVNEFETLLPKLYRPELDPAYHSFNAMDGDKFVGAIGAYPVRTQVLDMTLNGVGIGNVAVHPQRRGEGIMKKTLHMAIDDMVARGIDYSCLGGQRQRYNYFSYDFAGPSYRYRIGPRNMRYLFPVAPLMLTMEEVTAGDSETLDAIAALGDAQPCRPIRDRKELYPTLCSWRARPYAFRENGKFVGYCVLSQDGTTVTELLALDDAYVMEMARALCAKAEKVVTIVVPPFKPGYRKALEPCADGVDAACCEMFTVLCFRRVIEAFLKLKATYAHLANGSLTVLIHGCAGDERLEITVDNGQISVTTTGKEAAVELDHLQALSYFFAPVCYLRDSAPGAAQSWFPVPLWGYAADAV